MTKTAVAFATAFFSPGIATSGWAGAKAPHEHHVRILKFNFHPQELPVMPGDTIVWTNQDIAPHTATAADKSWDTGTIKTGESKNILVTPGMAANYVCRFHPKMKASVNMI